MSFVVDYIDIELRRAATIQRIIQERRVSEKRHAELETFFLKKGRNIDELFERDIAGKTIEAFDAKAIVENPIFRLSLSMAYDEVKGMQHEGVELVEGLYNVSYIDILYESEGAYVALVELARNKGLVEAIERFQPDLAERLERYAQNFEEADLPHIDEITSGLENAERLKLISKNIHKTLLLSFAERLSYNLI